MRKLYTFIPLSFVISSAAFGQPGIPCNPNTFWAVTNGQVVEWVITGTTITSNGVIVSAASPGNSLAFCNNLSGGTFSPTFYSHSFDKASYYDGTSWTTPAAISNCILSDAAGAGNNLYYSAFSLQCIDQFDGISFVQLYTSPNLMFTVADMAVDDAGNAWCLMGTGITDSIVVISPAGQVIKQFAFSLNTYNGYGCFLLNGVLYVAFGSANPVYPDMLLPITFTTTAAIAGTPISFNSNFAIDLASCNAGMPLSVAQHDLPVNDFIIYPNIASDYINCAMQVKINSKVNIRITDALGKMVHSSHMYTQNSHLQAKINISNLSNGIYFITIDDGTEKAVKRFIKN